MTQGKNFSNSIASAVGTLTEGKIAEPAAPEQNQTPEVKPIQKKPNKILLRIDPDTQAALQKKARQIAADQDRNYSLTELINDILKSYVQKNF